MLTVPLVDFSLTPELYKLIFPYFPPKSFRTHDRDEVERQRLEELRNEETFSASVEDMLDKAGKKDQFEPEGDWKAHFDPSELDVNNEGSSRIDTFARAIIDGEEYRSVLRNNLSPTKTTSRLRSSVLSNCRAGDVILVVGKGSKASTPPVTTGKGAKARTALSPWYARIIYFSSSLETEDCESKTSLHVEW